MITGWTFFYFAGEIKATVFGHEGQKTVRKALKRILAGQDNEYFNSLEITHVVFKHFLGLPYATVSFHIRNMQKSIFLSGSKILLRGRMNHLCCGLNPSIEAIEVMKEKRK